MILQPPKAGYGSFARNLRVKVNFTDFIYECFFYFWVID